MATWTKHRRSEIDRSVDFTDMLNEGETISSITEVLVTDFQGNDVTSEFGSPTGTINGNADGVDFTLGAAQSDTEQTKELYKVLVEILTSDGEAKASTDADGKVATLEVSQDGEAA